jgi:hypothetical protein
MKPKLTQDKYDSIPALLERGLGREEIAERFGVTLGTLQVQCGKRGISLRRGGRSTGYCTMTLPDAPLDLSSTAMIALRKKARSLGVDEAQLASDLLETIITDNLYDAVLDLEETA